MKKTYVLLGGLVLLIGIYFLFVFEKDQASLSPKDIAFAIQDTSVVNRIVLTQYREGNAVNSLQLDRLENGSWELDGEYPVFKPRINYLLRTMHLIHVKEKLIDQGINSAEEIFETYHTQMEAFGEEGLIKSYKIGTDAGGSRGTLMQLEDSDFPFIVELPGMQGFVNTHYSLDKKLWRENLLFKATPDQIKSLSITYKDPTKSFQLIREDANSDWRLFASESRVDGGQVESYFENFQGKVYAETFAAESFPGQYEALQEKMPDIVFSVGYLDGTIRTLRLFERPENANNFFGWIDGENDLLTVQHFVFDKYLVEKGYFLRGI